MRIHSSCQIQQRAGCSHQQPASRRRRPARPRTSGGALPHWSCQHFLSWSWKRVQAGAENRAWRGGDWGMLGKVLLWRLPTFCWDLIFKVPGNSQFQLSSGNNLWGGHRREWMWARAWSFQFLDFGRLGLQWAITLMDFVGPSPTSVHPAPMVSSCVLQTSSWFPVAWPPLAGVPAQPSLVRDNDLCPLIQILSLSPGPILGPSQENFWKSWSYDHHQETFTKWTRRWSLCTRSWV